MKVKFMTMQQFRVWGNIAHHRERSKSSLASMEQWEGGHREGVRGKGTETHTPGDPGRLCQAAHKGRGHVVGGMAGGQRAGAPSWGLWEPRAGFQEQGLWDMHSRKAALTPPPRKRTEGRWEQKDQPKMREAWVAWWCR